MKFDGRVTKAEVQTVIIFSIYCFMSDCKCIISRQIDAICCVATRQSSGIRSSSYAAIDFRIFCYLHDA